MIDDEIAVMCAALVARLSPTRIYLFGSFAEGKGTADSDIDIYIVVPDTDTDIAGITTTAYKAIRHMIQRPVNILVSTVSYFEHHKSIPSVECEVYRKGKLLYDTACKVQPERLYCFLQDDKSAKFIYRRRKPYLG